MEKAGPFGPAFSARPRWVRRAARRVGSLPRAEDCAPAAWAFPGPRRVYWSRRWSDAFLQASDHHDLERAEEHRVRVDDAGQSERHAQQSGEEPSDSNEEAEDALVAILIAISPRAIITLQRNNAAGPWWLSLPQERRVPPVVDGGVRALSGARRRVPNEPAGPPEPGSQESSRRRNARSRTHLRSR